MKRRSGDGRVGRARVALLMVAGLLSGLGAVTVPAVEGGNTQALKGGTWHLLGVLRSLEGEEGTLLFQWEQQGGPPTSGQVWRSWYTTPVGMVVAEDELRWGERGMVSYRYERNNVPEHSMVVRENGERRYFRKIKEDADRDTEPDSWAFTAGPGIIPWTQAHWSRLESGERVEVDYGVLDQMRSYRFELELLSDHPEASAGSRVIRMRLKNPFLRLFLDPILLRFNADGSRFLGLQGRVLPVTVVEGRMRPIDAKLIVERW